MSDSWNAYDSNHGLKEDAKRDEANFNRRIELQKEQEKLAHARSVKSKIAALEQERQRKHTELGAIQLELPRLKERISKAKRSDIDIASDSAVKTEGRAVEDLTHALEETHKKIEDLERAEHQTEDELRRHKEKLASAEHDDKRGHYDAKEEERVASTRLDDQERKGKVLEQEIKRLEGEIATLTREIA